MGLGRPRRGRNATERHARLDGGLLARATALSAADAPRALPARRGSKVYFAGSIVGQVCALLRYTLLARLLGPEQLGLVAALILVSNFFELISDTGSDRFLVQDKDGDEPQVQRLVQAVFLARGAFIALGFLICAWPVSVAYREPALFVGLAVMGLSPLINGLTHLDMRRFQRHNDFRAEGVGMLISELLALAVTVVAALITRDYTATLWGLITRSMIMVVVSHVFAERPYGFGYDKQAAARLMTFSVPLIANGLLLFVSGQSDRLMISGLIGLEALGRYSALLLLILYPSAALTRYLAGIHLPLVAADPTTPRRGAPPDLLGGRVFLMSAGMAGGFALVAHAAVLILYGPKFVQTPLMIGLVAVLQTGRFIRVWPTTLAMGLGKSRIVMANSFVRMIGIPAALAGLATIGGVAGIVVGFIVGEVAALVSGIWMVNRSRGFAWTHDFDRVAAFLAGSGLLIGLMAAVQYRWMPGLILVPATLAFIAWTARREREAITWGVQTLNRLVRRGR